MVAIVRDVAKAEATIAILDTLTYVQALVIKFLTIICKNAHDPTPPPA